MKKRNGLRKAVGGLRMACLRCRGSMLRNSQVVLGWDGRLPPVLDTIFKDVCDNSHMVRVISGLPDGSFFSSYRVKNVEYQGDCMIDASFR